MILRFPAPDVPWSINEAPANVRDKIKVHRRKVSWRDTTFWECKRMRRRVTFPMAPSTVRVTIPFTTSRRRDPHNYTSTVVKAIIDGLVMAGCWPDDNPDYVTVLDPILTVGPEVIVDVQRRSDVTVLG